MALLDTSVYLNVLDVVGWNQEREDVLGKFGEYVDLDTAFVLPMPSIWETGNHIADLSSGSVRRHYAEKFVADVCDALAGNAPYVASFMPDQSAFVGWLRDYPSFAQLNKSVRKTREGTSLADMMIIKEWERLCELHPGRDVWIWSLDSDLLGYSKRGSGW